jgi:PhoPQ-activated pathogenicity-related protein
MHVRLWSRTFVALVVTLCFMPAGRADLLQYIERPEPQFSWKVEKKFHTAGGSTVYDLKLVSQVWHDVKWTHQLQVYQPAGINPRSTMLMYNTGGKADDGNIALGLELARKTRSPVAILYDIPNQPLFDGKTEDGLIAETFVRYLATNDGSWPLLFPMVKSVVKAMDALQAFSKEEWKQPLDAFIISGASKRGWTTWLTGASDPRVKAIAPLVIDTLNMTTQMENQKRSFGTYSDQIADYTERGLVPIPDTENARHLWKMVDPYFYRERITQPKFLILGNNDPYWTVDALNLYWDGLKGDKYVTYVPNAGHDLSQDGKKDNHGRALSSLEAFSRLVIEGKPLPKVTWKNDESDGNYRITATADTLPSAACLWRAEAPGKDFRQSKWLKKPIVLNGSSAQGAVEPVSTGYQAFYLDLDYDADGIIYHLCTQIRVVPPAKKNE